MELRRHARKSLTVEFRGLESSGAGELVFEASDLSAGGTFLKADLLLERGERLWLQFRVPGVPKTFHAEGRVRWVRLDAHAGMGIEFETITDGDRAMLAQYLA